ncbi:60S ribosomal protein [Trypanosoma conorhini]|uniref:60S ribosomal protein n=1 Tax=Trypanosoma conorhini TaxID=83891 RepID=A0A3R7LEQ8_9TRYP|nr:60S ribosomal protein [Trypanosoma conorhini]RNF26946.1 60S ribosomal protein [Trypanosoma conorhini]
MRRIAFLFPALGRVSASRGSATRPSSGSSGPKLEELAGAYAQLTLKELSDLQRLIFKKLGHSDEFYEKALLRGLGGGGGGVMMPPHAVAAAAAAAPGAAATEEPPKAEKKKVEKTTYDVKLAKFTPDIKVKLIKELRSVTSLSISDAKSAIEKCPGLVQTNMRKEDAEKLKGLFEKLGATVELI